MKRRLTFVLITALIALLIVTLINGALRTKQAAINALQQGRVEIAVATRDLKPGSTIDPASVRLAGWPREDLPAGAMSDLKQVEGHITKQSVLQNQPLVSEMLLQPGKTGGVLPFLIPDGMRAMSISVTPVTDMAGMVLPHNRVDVLVTSGETGGSSERTRIVLQNVEVLAVQTTLDSADNAPQHADVVTLLVTPSEAERLGAASHLGTLQLAMRNYSDQQTAWTAGVDTRELLGIPATLPAQEQPSIKVPPPYTAVAKPQLSIEVIRNGKERQTVNFAQSRSLTAEPDLTSAIDPPGVGPEPAGTQSK
jgi:pilus assembly protein CpaB